MNTYLSETLPTLDCHPDDYLEEAKKLFVYIDKIYNEILEEEQQNKDKNDAN